MNMTITPLKDIVLVKVDPVNDKTESGLLIKQDWKSLPPTGTVQAVGPQVTNVRPGDQVLFDRYASIILENDLRLCKESHIHAKI